MIVEGTITVQDETVLLNVERTLKGQERRQIKVLYVHWFEAPDPHFKNGEDVLLFLGNPDPNANRLFFPDIVIPKENEMYLYGLGDMAKWPKTYADPNKDWTGYPRLLNVAPLNAIETLVEKILVIENAPDLGRKVDLCTEYIRSPDPSLQYVTLEYVRFRLLWPSPPGSSHPIIPDEMREKERQILRQIAREALPLVDSNEPLIRARAMLMLRYRPPTETMPHLIEGITDEYRGAREAARQVLNILARVLKVEEPFVDFNSGQPPEQLRSVQRQWNAWWESNRVRVKALEDRWTQ
jgi:hypothetical protein